MEKLEDLAASGTRIFESADESNEYDLKSRDARDLLSQVTVERIKLSGIEKVSKRFIIGTALMTQTILYKLRPVHSIVVKN